MQKELTWRRGIILFKFRIIIFYWRNYTSQKREVKNKKFGNEVIHSGKFPSPEVRKNEVKFVTFL
jgi:hypothetical protein